MAISDKLTYLGETKSQLKTMLQYANSNITNDTTFRAYVSGLFQAYINILNNPNTLWGNLPKITGTGTNISLNNTIEAPMKIEYNPSEISQSGTPTPSSPQDIHTISGNNTIKVEGKNLLAPNLDTYTYRGITLSITNNGWLVNGTMESSYTSATFVIFEKDLPAGTYTINGISGASGTTYQTRLYYNGEAQAYIKSTDLTFTITETTTIRISLYVYSAYGTFNNLLLPYQLEKGSSATTYEPHQENTYPINLDFDYCKIGNYEDRIFKNVSGDTDYSSDREDGAWYIKKNIGKVVLDGSESGWWYQNNQFRWSLPNPSIYGSMFYSQHFAKDSSENANTPNKGFIYNANYYKINNGIDGITDIAGFKTWLSINNDTFYYILREPTYTKITGELANQLEAVKYSMEGTTNISQVNNDLPFELSVSALEDLR